MEKALTDKISKQEKMDRLVNIFTEANDNGVRVMLFDYGTWIRPDGGHKNSQYYARNIVFGTLPRSTKLEM